MACRLIGVVCSTILAASLYAARLPVHTFAASDGMPRDAAFCVVPDSRGFLWLCTNEGLSWFDGYRFNNYSVQQGLAHRVVNTVLETSGGTFLVGTDGGLSRRSSGKFHTVPTAAPTPKGVFDLIQDRDGVVWGAGFNGIFRLDYPDREDSQLHYIDIAHGDQFGITALAMDGDGTLWMGTSKGLACRRPNGSIEWPKGAPADPVNAVLIDRESRLWIATLNGLWRGECLTKDFRFHRLSMKQDGLRSQRVHRLFQSSNGTIWIGTAASLSELWIDERGQEHFRNYSAPEGLRGRRVTAIGEDQGGNLWVGMDQGLSRISRSGFVTYSESEGLGDLAIAAVITGPGRDVFAISNHTDSLVLHHIEKDRVVSVVPYFPPTMHYFGWGWDQIAFIDREQRWWIATGEGLLHYPRVADIALLAQARPEVYNARNANLPGNDVFRIFEDSRGDVWISAIGGAPVRWRRATKQFEPLPHSYFRGLVSTFAEDRAGDIWMGVSNEAGTGNPTGLVRYREGRYERLEEAANAEAGALEPGPDSGWIAAMLLDHAGRLWVGTASRGLEMISDPTADHPRVTPFRARLSSVSVRCLAEDRQGRIWAGTARGLDRLDPSTGEVRYFNISQGYPGGGCSALRFDSEGTLWAGSSIALSRFVPGGDGMEQVPAVYITGVSVEGQARAGGDQFPLAIKLGELTPDQNQLRIEFASPAAVQGRTIRYEYALARGSKISRVISDQRTVEYPGLAPGRYRFQVSALDERGQRSSAPAEILFEILPPVWARWWFLSLLAATAAASIHVLYRFRLSKQLELERLRTRLAADLHDDLGASLSRVAIMSETVRLEMDRRPAESRERLNEIAATARNMVDGMSDLVWSIDPRKDDMQSLLRRIRQFASGVLEAEGIDWTLEVEPAVNALSLNAERRRHLFLILKEGIANAAKHARCSSVRIEARIQGPQFVASIEDNGCGFANASPTEGNGFRNMCRRAEALGGSLIIEGSAGTRVLVVFPVHSHSIHSPLA